MPYPWEPLAQHPLCNQGANVPKSKPHIWNLDPITKDTLITLVRKPLQPYGQTFALIPV